MDKDTFWEIINPMQEHFFRLALSILNDREDAQDATHDVIMKLWSKRKRLNDKENIRSYMLTTVKNYCLDKLRKNRGHLSLEVADIDATVEDNFAAKDMVEVIKKRIEQLPLQQRMIVDLKDFQGYSYVEISEILETPVSTLRVQLSRARKIILSNINCVDV